jgi:hypothetical protein
MLPYYPQRGRSPTREPYPPRVEYVDEYNRSPIRHMPDYRRMPHDRYAERSRSPPMR